MKKLNKIFVNYFFTTILLLSTGYIDYITGYNISIQFLYFIPLYLAVLCAKSKKVILILFSIFAAILWFLANYFTEQTNSSLLIVIWNAFSRLIVFSIFTLFLNAALVKRDKINQLNDKLMDKNKFIFESISYAENIQTALVPSFRTFLSYLPQSFIIFKPKDILSGDFFWYYKRDDKIFFALADSTGHGVPGAMLSIIGNILLNKIIIDNQISDTSEILTRLNSEMISLFQKGDKSIDDGMEISLVVLDTQTNKITISQTSPNIIIIKNDKSVIEAKFNIYTIGGLLSKVKKPVYTAETLDMEQGDMIYLFSDGYVDQFKADNRTKFGMQQFYDLLIENHSKEVLEQSNNFEKAFEKWKDGTKQIDDVTVIGIRLIKS